MPDNNTPRQWVVDCRHAGRGKPAIEYLSRYLYRGVISESNILASGSEDTTIKLWEMENGRQVKSWGASKLLG